MYKHLDSIQSLPEAFLKQAALTPQSVVYSQYDVSQGLRPCRYCEAQKSICSIAAGLHKLGVRAGEKIAILSNTRPEWMLADLGALSAGAVVVSVYQSLQAADIAYILFDSESSVVFAENQEQVNKLLQIQNSEWDIPGHEDRAAGRHRVPLKKIISFESVEPHPLVISLSELMLQNETTQPPDLSQISRQTLAALVYTSGTTGPPKGVMQTHGNHLANVRQTWDSGLLSPRTSIFLLLPLAHSFAKLMGYLGFLSDVELRFPSVSDRLSSKPNPMTLSRDMRESAANVIPLVPRMLEKMQDALQSQARQNSSKGLLVRHTLEVSAKIFQAKKNGRSGAAKDKLISLLLEPIRKKIRKSIFGANFRFVISGGAKLSVNVHEFFDGLGIIILEGFGLTETCVATNVATPKRRRIGSVGPVLAPDIEMKIAEDGEVIYRGANIASGYYLRPTATKASWDDAGWFHTGDLGRVDANGFLEIIGRKKEILVTSGGKNIAPFEIEQALKTSPLVSQAVLIGDGRKYCVALLTLNTDSSLAWLSARGQYADPNALTQSSELQAEIRRMIDAINKTRPSHETIKSFFIAPEDFTIDNGLLTPTMKVKRSTVEARYKAEIDQLYA